MNDSISRQAAIDALHQYFTDGFEEDRWWNSTHVLAALEQLPPAEPEQTYCEYCHEDSDGYVTPLEKNCHVVVECCPIDGWILSVKYGTWRKDVPIRYCPMCGRELKNG